MSPIAAVELSIFVEHGREAEAEAFYRAAFGAETLEELHVGGVLAGVKMKFRETVISVVGANPNRESEPARGGPFYPKANGAVSAFILLNVADPEAVLDRAVTAGATIRNQPERDDEGRMMAALFDPFGHIWGLVSVEAAAMRDAA